VDVLQLFHVKFNGVFHRPIEPTNTCSRRSPLAGRLLLQFKNLQLQSLQFILQYVSQTPQNRLFNLTIPRTCSQDARSHFRFLETLVENPISGRKLNHITSGRFTLETALLTLQLARSNTFRFSIISLERGSTLESRIFPMINA